MLGLLPVPRYAGDGAGVGRLEPSALLPSARAAVRRGGLELHVHLALTVAPEVNTPKTRKIIHHKLGVFARLVHEDILNGPEVDENGVIT